MNHLNEKSKPSSVPNCEYFFTRPEEAKRVLDAIKTIISHYSVATVADLKELIGYESKYTDRKYGWVKSDSMRVQMLDYYNPDRGYLLKMPRPYLIDSDDTPNFKPALPKSAKDAKIQKAYNVLTKAYCRYDTNEDDFVDAMGEAIRYLGEVLE